MASILGSRKEDLILATRKSLRRRSQSISRFLLAITWTRIHPQRVIRWRGRKQTSIFQTIKPILTVWISHWQHPIWLLEYKGLHLQTGLASCPWTPCNEAKTWCSPATWAARSMQAKAHSSSSLTSDDNQPSKTLQRFSKYNRIKSKSLARARTQSTPTKPSQCRRTK